MSLPNILRFSALYLIISLSSCVSLVDKEAIIGTWVCEDVEFVEDENSPPIPPGLVKRAENSARKMVFTFYDEKECSIQLSSRRKEVDTYYEIEEEEEMLYIFDERYRGKRSKAKIYDIYEMNDEVLILGTIYGDQYKANLKFYKED